MPGPHMTTGERLRTYRAKRDFSITAEPEGTRPPPADGRRFVVQRHRARALHYDLRLETDGVLVSWAVPKGPTLDPSARRLAVHVEDHPLDYYDFEGVIAAGEYGGGDVIIWDWGTWELAEGADALDEIADGDLHIAFHGLKLKGRFALVRRGRDRATREQWLLIKKRDDEAVAGWDPEQHPRSVKTGRTNDEVHDAPAARWTSSVSWAAPTDEELDALTGLGPSGTWRVGGHDVALRGLDDVVFPASTRDPAADASDGRPARSAHTAVTTRDLVRHHAAIAPALLAYLADRPLELRRFPSGADGRIVRPRTIPSRAPGWLHRWSDDGAPHVIADSAASLAWLAGWRVLELRPWASTTAAPSTPTWAVFDIDAGQHVHDALVEVVGLHRTALEHMGMEARPVLTGPHAVQVWVPIAARLTVDAVRTWVATVAHAIAATVPDLVADGLRLGPATTTPAAPFSALAAPGAPVVVPMGWDELGTVAAGRWSIRDVGNRLREAGDPLAPLVGRQQRLPSL